MSIATLDNSSSLAFLRSASLPSLIEGKIEQMILNGELAAGERVNELALAQQMGVGRSPIREACRKLEQAGLVEVIKNRGVFVRSVDVQQALDIYEIRGALAELAGGLIAERATDEDIAELRDMVGQMDALAHAGDVDEYYRSNIAFHARLAQCTRNARLIEMFQGTDKELHLYRHRSLMQPEGLVVSNKEHNEIVQAIAARDIKRARQAFKRHVLNGKTRAVSAIPKEG
ncbi:FCD domain-containing protein [Alcaligenaceae bacterium]|nr:FCD domain-containing protein [Alcaligenaceae bacterium]